jgi:hypothetical protein
MLILSSLVVSEATVGEVGPVGIAEARNQVNERLKSHRFFVDDEIRDCLRQIKDHGSMEDVLLWTRAAYFYRLEGYQIFKSRLMGFKWDPLENLGFLRCSRILDQQS